MLWLLIHVIQAKNSKEAMEQQLSQLTPQQRQAVMMQAQQEANQKIMQDMLQRMVKTCFTKCTGTSVRLKSVGNYSLYCPVM